MCFMTCFKTRACSLWFYGMWQCHECFITRIKQGHVPCGFIAYGSVISVYILCVMMVICLVFIIHSLCDGGHMPCFYYPFYV